MCCCFVLLCLLSGSDHKCSLTASSKYSGDVSLVNNENVNELFLKYGERNGAEDGNKVGTDVFVGAKEAA